MLDAKTNEDITTKVLTQILLEYEPVKPTLFQVSSNGPSRTGDIERILVLGAHGPRILTIILLQDQDGTTKQ